MAKALFKTKSNNIKQILLPHLVEFVFDKKQQFIDQSHYSAISREDYEDSCIKAELLGYKRQDDYRAYGGAYYFDHNGKIWIHRLANLAYRMDFQTLQDAEDAGYNVDDYFEYLDLSPDDIKTLLSKREMQDIYQNLCTNIYDEELVYLCDGVYLNSEGELIDTKS